ncbi:MAG: Phospholipase D/Transphosphatidylase [Mesotoga prima]|uniref:phospholipase D n=1 Tax=Mesotoga prima TaxID=1184387 RepID=A0A117M151_9BACT|nr:MAG: Phospholipase D/Transphosphatidylase [Mesotoga prima]
MKRFFLAVVILLVAVTLPTVFFTDDGRAVERIVEILERAQEEVVLVSYSLDEQEVIDCLNRLCIKGLSVSVVIDNSTVSRTFAKSPQFKVMTDTTAALVHSKFIVVDSQIVVFGTGNFTEGSLREDSNSFIMIESESLASLFLDYYKAILTGDSRGVTSVGNMTLFLCPSEEARKRVIKELMSAKEEIRFAMFAFTDPKILAALKFCASKGVRVFGMVDSWNEDSPLKDYLTTGMEVSRGVSITIHDKTFVIDRNIVITGSANASLSGWGKNREIVVIIESRDVANQFISHFEYVREVSK